MAGTGLSRPAKQILTARLSMTVKLDPQNIYPSQCSANILGFTEILA
jgi:hypothetical protein